MTEPVKLNFTCPFCHAHESFHDQGQFDMIVRHMVTHAEKMPVSALRERDERIAALEKTLLDIETRANDQYRAWSAIARIARAAQERIVALEAENARLAAPVTRDEWKHPADSSKE